MILSRAEAEKIQRDVASPAWIRGATHIDVRHLCDTLAASQAALEAWVEWSNALCNRPYLELRAIELTKAAGIEWASEVSNGNTEQG